MSILLSICLAIIFAPFVALADSEGLRILFIVIGAAAVVLPYLSIWLAPAYTAAQIRKTPCLTIVGLDYILVCNRYIGINDRMDLKLKTAGVTTRDGGFEVLVLVYTFRGRYGGRIDITVEAPIPRGRTEEAGRFTENRKAARREKKIIQAIRSAAGPAADLLHFNGKISRCHARRESRIE